MHSVLCSVASWHMGADLFCVRSYRVRAPTISVPCYYGTTEAAIITLLIVLFATFYDAGVSSCIDLVHDLRVHKAVLGTIHAGSPLLIQNIQVCLPEEV